MTDKEAKDLCDTCRWRIGEPTYRTIPYKFVGEDDVVFEQVKEIVCKKFGGRIHILPSTCKLYEERTVQSPKEEPANHDVPIKPCPFCGGTPEITWRDCYGDIIYDGPSEIADEIGLYCQNCHTTMWGDYFSEEDRERLIERWNRRVRE